MKKFLIYSIVALFCSVISLNGQTTCDPPSPDKLTGRCSYYNWPEGDIAVCNDTPVVGQYCGYGSATQT